MIKYHFTFDVLQSSPSKVRLAVFCVLFLISKSHHLHKTRAEFSHSVFTVTNSSFSIANIISDKKKILIDFVVVKNEY